MKTLGPLLSSPRALAALLGLMGVGSYFFKAGLDFFFPSSQNQKFWFQSEPLSGSRSVLALEDLFESWQKHAPDANFSKLGLLPLLHDIPQKSASGVGWRLQSEGALVDEMRFLNFGPRGFLLAHLSTRAKSSSANLKPSFEWLRIHASQPPLPSLSAVPDNPFPLQSTALQNELVALQKQDGVNAEVSAVDSLDALALFWIGGMNCLAHHQQRKARTVRFPCDISPPPYFNRTKSDSVRNKDSDFTLTERDLFGPLQKESYCYAAPQRAPQTLELIGTPEGPFCLHYLGRTDDRYVSHPVNSSLACIHPKNKNILFPSSERAQIVLPSQKKSQYFVLDSYFTPPKFSVLNLEDLTFSNSDEQAMSLGEKKQSKIPQLPQHVRLYACRDGISTAPQWYALDHDISIGTSAADTTTDRVVRFQEKEPGKLEAGTPSWQKIIAENSPLALYPPISCAFLTSTTDFRCGLRIVQHTGQLALEALWGDLQETISPQTRAMLYTISLRALENIQKELPLWQLAKEVQLLQNFFKNAKENSNKLPKLRPAEKKETPKGTEEVITPHLNERLLLPPALWDQLPLVKWD